MTVVACPPNTPPAPGLVVFSAAEFTAAYPMFATVDPGVLGGYFGRATLLLNSGCCSRVRNPNKRQVLLYLLVAHFSALYSGVNGQPPSGVVGRISQGTEGTVSVTAEMPSNPEAAWYMQTQWGAEYWNATAVYRTMLPIVAPRPSAFALGVGTDWPFGGFDGSDF